MNSTEITIKLPDTLVERAKAEGVPLDDASIANMIEAELIRAKAVRQMRETMQKLEGSLTLDEIEEELSRAKVDRNNDT